MLFWWIDPDGRNARITRRTEAIENREIRRPVRIISGRREELRPQSRIGGEQRPQYIGPGRVDSDSQRIVRRKREAGPIVERQAVARIERCPQYAWRLRTENVVCGRLRTGGQHNAPRYKRRLLELHIQLQSACARAVVLKLNRRLPAARFIRERFGGEAQNAAILRIDGNRQHSIRLRGNSRIALNSRRAGVDDFACLTLRQIARLCRKGKRCVRIERAVSGLYPLKCAAQLLTVSGEARERLSQRTRGYQHHAIVAA